MLGEGFDHPPLSVAAIFRPFRSLSPYIQFVGRIMRVNVEGAPEDPNNHGYVVSHVGLNNDAQWDDFRELDLADQEMFRRWVNGSRPTDDETSNGEGGARRFDVGMQVTQEILGDFVTNDPFLDLDDDRVIEKIAATPIPGMAGVTLGHLVEREALRARLRAAQPPRQVPTAPPTPVPPQRARQAGRKRLNDRSKSVANRVLADLELAPRGYDLMNIERGGRRANLEVVIEMVAREVNAEIGQEAATRADWSRDQIEHVMAMLDAIGDRVRDVLRSKVHRKSPRKPSAATTKRRK
jgi:hypothetical protein